MLILSLIQLLLQSSFSSSRVHKEALLSAAWFLIYFLVELWPNGVIESPITALLCILLAHVGLTS